MGLVNPTCRFREPGKVRAGADGRVEWTQEPQTERDDRVGFAAGEALTYP